MRQKGWSLLSRCCPSRCRFLAFVTWASLRMPTALDIFLLPVAWPLLLRCRKTSVDGGKYHRDALLMDNGPKARPRRVEKMRRVL